MPGDNSHVWYNDLTTIHKMMKDMDFGSICPSCKMPFDKGKKRKLTDVCGHDRCYSCIYNSDKCALCLNTSPSPSFTGLGKQQPEPCSKGEAGTCAQLPPLSVSRSKLKTNGHFTTYMQTRSAQCSNPSSIDFVSHINKLHTFSSADDEETVAPPPTVHTAKSDLYMRLGLLLGDKFRGRGTRQKGPSSQSSSQESYASASSLNSCDNTKTSSNNVSPLSTLTGFSESESLNAPSFSLSSSLDPSLDSVTSASPIGTLPRRHSVTTNSSGQLEDIFPFDERKSVVRRSARAGSIKGPIDPKVRFAPYRPLQINLKPQFFEVPQLESDPIFVGRHWLFKEIEQELTSASSGNNGVIIIGGVGNGKTSIVLQLVEYSCFGRRQQEPIYQDINGSCISLLTNGSTNRLNLLSDSVRTLGGQVVAYHFCQADNNLTCLVPDFVHSIAAQLCQAPQLVAYRTLLASNSELQSMLTPKACIADSSLAFSKGVLDPLDTLKLQGKIPTTTSLIVIDGLDEAEYHRPDYGDTIASFLGRHLNKFPTWLKVIVTVRPNFQETIKSLPFHRISLDRVSTNEFLQRDLHDYITVRITTSPTIPNNIAINGKMDSALQTRFTSHLLHQSRGSFLYLRLTLDLVERGQLVMKSTSFKVLPQNLNEIYMLHFNLKFPSVRSFERIDMILNVCLASLYSMNLLEIYHSVNAGGSKPLILWEDFIQRMDILTGFLIQRQDGTYMFFHPSFRECPRAGHSNIAFRMSRLEAPLDFDKTCELGHHILKAHLYKNFDRLLGYTSRDMQALWLCHSSADISSALGSLRNSFSPNVKVSRLLLLSGANPNFQTSFADSTLLMVASQEGFTDMISLLLEFGANVNITNSSGHTALCLAALKGHLDIVRLLYTHGAQINYLDPSGHCALSYAAINGHIAVTSFLLQSDWPNSNKSSIALKEASQRALVSAASSGHKQVCEYLLNLPIVGVDLIDTLSGETALTAAAAKGHRDTCTLLLHCGGGVSVCGHHGIPALVSAVHGGHWEVVEVLLMNNADVDQMDGSGRTSLMTAAAEGHLGILELLLSKGADVNKTNRDNQTALCIACHTSQVHVAQCLLQHGADINHTDRTGRTPLDFAAASGDPAVVQLLLDKGALVEHVDHNGMRPLDRAISYQNADATLCFLRKGAKLGPSTWATASGKSEIMLLLLNKLLEDGSILYKKNRFVEASHRYQYALKKFPVENSGVDETAFRHLKHQMMINLIRCKRKLNEFEAALELTNKLLESSPQSFEAYYARTRIYRDMKQIIASLQDLETAMKLAPQNKDVHRVLKHLQDELKEMNNPAGNLLELHAYGGSLEAIVPSQQMINGVLV
uniref:RING-type domain-containing protein n=1 Tax=Strigamia maritima TaxID=126957 RepID=T1IZI4_STRMM